MKLGDHFDQANYVLIELIQLFGRYPVFYVNRAANRLDLIPGKKIAINRKTGYKSRF